MISLIPLNVLLAFTMRFGLVYAGFTASGKEITMIPLLFAPLPRIRLIYGKRIKGIKRIILKRSDRWSHLGSTHAQ
jgi:hypothetical protein